MTFESAEKAAERMGVTVRAVQKWAKEGRIPYAYKEGRDWKIPISAKKPGEVRFGEVRFHEPMPIVHIFAPGKAMDYIESIEDPSDRAMALCEYHYMRGEFKECTIIAEPFMDSLNPVLRSTSALFCMFSNLCRGHMVKSRYAAEVIRTTLNEVVDGEYPNETKASCLLCAKFLKVQLHLPLEDLKKMEHQMRYLDEGVRLMACYLLAHVAYLDKDYERALGIVETALAFASEDILIPQIYLGIVGAMALMNLMRVNEAREALRYAWKAAEKDGFILPFVEHYSLLQGMVEKEFKKDYPEEYRKILQVAKEFNESWYRVYNENSNLKVAENLTPTEFTVAMLYSRNWRAKEIAEHMELSERTIMNYITIVYDKLQINSKKELCGYMLR